MNDICTCDPVMRITSNDGKKCFTCGRPIEQDKGEDWGKVNLDRGFTLAELLVVIGLVVLFVAVLLASLQSPHDTAPALPAHISFSHDVNLDDIDILKAQVRQLSCEVKGGVYIGPKHIPSGTYYVHEPITADDTEVYLLESCTKNATVYSYQNGAWVSTTQKTL